MKTTRMAAAIAFVASACATTPPAGVALADLGSPVTFGNPRFKDIGNQVAFDHGCPPERVRVIRSEWHAVDVDVCGVVRRYKSVGVDATWLDVTNLYPATSLPQPLPASPPPPPAAKPQAAEQGADGMMRW